MEALFREQGKSTRLVLSTMAAVFEPGGPHCGFAGSSAFEKKSNDAACEQLHDLDARSDRCGSVSARSEDLDVILCFVRIHVALRWGSGEETQASDGDL